MLDDTMGPALAATLGPGQFAPTLNLNVSFERPGKVGTVVGHGRVLKRGSDVCFLAGELFQDGKRIASATATALIRTMPTGPDAGMTRRRSLPARRRLRLPARALPHARPGRCSCTAAIAAGASARAARRSRSTR